MAGDGQIAAIKVGLGIDLNDLRRNTAKAREEFEKNFPSQKTINVHVAVTGFDKGSLDKLWKDTQQYLDGRAKGAGNAGLRLTPSLQMDPRTLRDFRRDTERQMRQQAAQGNAIRIPIKPIINARQFRTELIQQLGGFITVPVRPHFEGNWNPPGGGGPAGPARGGPRPGPTTGGPAAGGPAAGGPPPSRARPARPTARQAPPTPPPPTRPARRSSATTMGGGVEVSSSDRYEVPEAPPAAPRPPRGGQAGGAPTPRQARQAERRERMTGQPTNSYGPGSRDTVGASRNPNYVEPEGGRVTIGNVRSGSVPPELKGAEREAYIAQQRAGGRDFSPNAAPSATGRVRGRPTSPEAIERLERMRRYQASRARGESPADIAAREHAASAFRTLDPALGAAFARMSDPTDPYSFADFAELGKKRREVYGTRREVLREGTKKQRRQQGVITGRKKGDINEVDPTMLLIDAGLDAARQYERVQLNPLETVKTGDTKGRKPGGKVGKVGGLTAGTLASESREPVETEAGIAKARRRKTAPIAPVEEGEAYGGFMEDAPSIPGGHGVTRKDTSSPAAIEKETAARSRAKAAREAEERTFGRRERMGRARPGSAGSMREGLSGEARARTEVPPQPDFGAAGRPRAQRPPRPESRAYGRNTGYAGGRAGADPFFEFLRGFRGTSPGAQRAGQAPLSPRDQRIAKLKAMASQTEQSPNEASIAAQLLRRMRVPGFAEGGIIHLDGGGKRPNYKPYLGMDLSGSIHGRILAGMFPGIGPIPKQGTIARRDLETRARTGIQNRLEREKKPLHQQGGKSDTEFETNKATKAEQILARSPDGIRCQNCGRMTTDPKDRGPLALRWDHKVDKVPPDNSPGNLQPLCNSCNSFKSGGSKRRDPRQAPHLRMYAEGGNVKWGGLANRRGGIRSATMVGERGPEIMVEGHNGEAEIIPSHKVASFMDGMGKRGDGGLLRGADGLTMRGPRGPRAATVERLSSGVVAGGDITRVFVTNWPDFLKNAQNFARGFGQAQNTIPPAQRVRAQANAPGAQAGPAGPAAGGQPGAPGTGAAGRARADFNPTAGVEARRQASQDVGGFNERIGAVRAGISGSLQEAPVRALSVAFGQIAQQMIGGRKGILERARTAQGLAGEAQTEVNELERLRRERGKLEIENRDIDRGITELSPEDAAATKERNLRRIPRFQEAEAEQEVVAEEVVSKAEKAEKTVLTRPQQFRAQAVGLGGIVGGTAVFSTAIAATNFAATAAAAALGPLVDETNAWSAALDKSSGSIRDSVQQLRAVGGRQIAQAGLGLAGGFGARGTDQILGGLAARGEQQAAARVQQEALAATRGAAGAITRPNEPLFSGTGGLFGGSLFASQMGGQMGVLETVVKQLQGTNIQGSALNRARGPGGIDVGPIRGGDPNNALQQGSRAINRFVAGISEEEANRRGAVQGPQLEQLRTDTIRDVNDSLDRFAQSIGNTTSQFEVLDQATEDQKNAMIKSAAEIGSEEETRARELAKEGVAVTGRGGAALRGRDFGTFAQQYGQGRLIADPSLLMRQTANERKATAFQIQAQAEFARQQDLPAQFALGRIAQPGQRFGTTFSTRGQAGATTAGGSEAMAQSLKNIDKYTQLVAGANSKIEAYQAEGVEAMEKIVSQIDNPTLTGGIGTPASLSARVGGGRPVGVTGAMAQAAGGIRGGPGPALTAFRGIVGEIGTIGEEIASITQNINMRQQNLQIKEYNNSIRITARSLGDAKDFWAAINGSTSRSLGGLQGQNVLLERQNQLLGRRAQRLAFKSEDIGFKQSDLQQQAQQMQFQMSQRQINFSKAIAGFTAPGTTPEERAARINEAKVEADFAQKQLDIQMKIAELAKDQLKLAKEQSAVSREQFANANAIADNQFAIQREEAARAITDLNAQLGLLEEGRALTIDSAAAEATIEKLQKAQGILVEQAQEYLKQGTEIRTQVLQDAAKLIAITGGAFSRLVGSVQSAWSEAFLAAYHNYIIPLNKAINQSFSGGGGGGGTPGQETRDHWATGGIFDATKATQFIAGEAGNESVVVIRNPQKGTLLGGGGGGTGTVVNVGGISIVLQGSGNNEQDAEAIARMVEQKLASKLAAMG